MRAVLSSCTVTAADHITVLDAALAQIPVQPAQSARTRSECPADGYHVQRTTLPDPPWRPDVVLPAAERADGGAIDGADHQL